MFYINKAFTSLCNYKVNILVIIGARYKYHKIWQKILSTIFYTYQHFIFNKLFMVAF